ncbi:MAG TPA: beta-eliminating lyase-related protein [Ktedonobacteraceae bacterium]|nr:beta-eliminating lyase-related protein [Ktedonobacteraceae bacterium]
MFLLLLCIFHPTCHLEIHEQHGYQRLHHLPGILLGESQRLLTLEDVKKVAEPLAALLIELPQREIGGQLPAWEDLTALTDRARERGIVLHLDGARLWECQPFYGREYRKIAALFDTVYVSFYKILGGIAGAVLAAPRWRQPRPTLPLRALCLTKHVNLVKVTMKSLPIFN